MKQMGWGTCLSLTLPSRGPAPGQRQTGAEADLAHCVTEIIKMGKMMGKMDGDYKNKDRKGKKGDDWLLKRGVWEKQVRNSV